MKATHPEMIKAFRILNSAPEYTTDKKGRKVRVFSKDMPCTADDVYRMCLNVRALDEEEILESVGQNVFKYMVAKGYLRAQGAGLYVVTKACQKAYNLPNPRLTTGATANYVH